MAPRISINELANYLVSTPAQRKSIIKGAKAPQTFRVNYYDFARNAINDFVRHGMVDESTLTDASSQLYGRNGTNDQETIRFQSNAEAVDAFLNCYDQIVPVGFSIEIASNVAPKLTIQGVEISVRPEFLLSGVYRNEQCCGGVKLYFSKLNPLDEISSPYITAVLMQHIQQYHQAAPFVTKHAACVVLDVFAQATYVAPRAITKRFSDIDAACQEIMLWWNAV